MLSPYTVRLSKKYGDDSAITRSEYNALVEAVQRLSSSGQASFQDSDSNGVFDKAPIVPYFFQAACSIEIPAYAVFTLKKDAPADVPPLLVPVTAATPSWQPVLLVNEGNEFSGTGASKVGLARGADRYRPFRVKVNKAVPANIPKTGQSCGPLPDSFLINNQGHGLLCLGIEESEDYAYCIAASPGDKWLCKPIATITKNGGIGDVYVWTGQRGGETATTQKYSVCNRTGADCVNAKFCEIEVIEGKLYVVPWEC